jgi:hypothetical protein
MALSLVPGTPHLWQPVVPCHFAVGQPPLVCCDRKGGERPWIERKRFAGLVASPQQQTRTVLAGAWRDRQLDAGYGLPVDGRICGSPAFIERGQDGVSLLVDLPERQADWQS